MKKLILSDIFALFLLSGCKTNEVVNSNNREVINNQISTTIVHDTVISYLPQKQEVKTNQKSKLSTDFSFSIAWVDSTGLLNHSIENFKVVPAQLIEKKVYSSKRTTLNITKTITITKTVKITVDQTRWYGYADIFILAILAAICLFKIYKRFYI